MTEQTGVPGAVHDWDLRWIGGFNTAPACHHCRIAPPAGRSWSFYCGIHGHVCGVCKRLTPSVKCPKEHP